MSPGRAARIRLVAAGLAAAALLVPAPAAAFVYTEHRHIAGRAIAGLDPERAAVLARLWAAARTGHEGRLCADPWAGEQGLHPQCIDLAAFTAIGGDHSCSPALLLAAVLEGSEILRKASVTAREEDSLAEATKESQRRNAATRAQVTLARIDPAYATRAGANNAHFLLARRGQDLNAYLADIMRDESEPNSLATYMLFHAAAMRTASEIGPRASGADAAARARLALALEAFAEHFLEDMFAAGHVAGTWGKPADRKGTHDFYNRNGLEIRTWGGRETLLFGDAFMQDDGLARAADAVRTSLSQFLDAATPGSAVRSDASAVAVPAPFLDGSYDLCAARAAPGWIIASGLAPYFGAVVEQVPVPFRAAGAGSLPRYHAEMGPYVGLTAGGSLAGGKDSFDDLDTDGQLINSLFLTARLGLGLEELLTYNADGLIFLDAGVALSGKEATDCPDCDPGVGGLLPRVPARSGLSARLRMPFFVVPGDLILTAPILFFNPDAYTRIAAAAASGGLLPWQTKIASPVGHFQVMLGREVGATFYGFAGGEDELVTIVDDEDVIVGLRSVLVEIPALEWEPFRSYGQKQTLGVRFQFGAGFDKPVRARVLAPAGVRAPNLQTRYFGYLRLVVEARRYL